MLARARRRSWAGAGSVLLAMSGGVVLAAWLIQAGAFSGSEPASGMGAAAAQVSGQAVEAGERPAGDPAVADAAVEVPPGLRLVRGEAAAFIPRTWEDLAATTAGPALVRPLEVVRTEAPGATRHRVTAEEAAELNAARPEGSLKPNVREGDWIGAVGPLTTVYLAEVQWLDGRPTERLELNFLGGTYADSFVVVDGMPLPKLGEEYLLFLAVGNGWTTPAYVQFAVESGIAAPHMHNEDGVGADLLGLPVPKIADMARAQSFRNEGGGAP